MPSDDYAAVARPCAGPAAGAPPWGAECRIDAIAQSWAVLSGAGDEGRAMDAVAERLVRQDDRLIQPLTPPFDKTDHDPSYIKGYPPRERENGGQYTHAALWTVWAFVGVGSRAVHHIRVENADGVQTGVKGTVLDGEHTEPGEIPLADDEKGHEVVLWMGRDS